MIQEKSPVDPSRLGLLTRGWVFKILFSILSLSFVITRANAHDLNSSYTEVIVTADSLQIAFTFDITALSRNFGVDANRNQALEREELIAGAPGIYHYLEEHATLVINFAPVQLERRKAWSTQDDFGNVFVSFLFATKLSGLPAEISLNVDFFEKFGEQHKNLAKIAVGEQLRQAVFTKENSRQRFNIGGEFPLLRQIGQFVKLGIEHIFLGYDHIIFLFALIVIGGRLMNLVKIVSAFTVAHSITLILAALGMVKLPPQIIESSIALSIAYVAAENFVISQSDHRWVLTFIFGLLHGFGFANVLRDFGLPAAGLVPSLLAFNGGVEIGQLCIVAVFFPFTLWVAKQKFQRRMVFVSSSVILLLGLGWFVERAFNISFMPL